MANDEVNRAVAVALGYRSVGFTERDVWRGTIRGMTSEQVIVGISPRAGGNAGMPEEIPNFCADPAAADRIMRHAMTLGWEICMTVTPLGDDKYSAYASVDVNPFGDPNGPLYYSPHDNDDAWPMTLCLAFLAAVEAEKKEQFKEVEK